MASDSLSPLIYEPGDSVTPPKLQVLDQLLIPTEKTFVDVPDIQATWSVIRKMQIRGAPLIAIVAVLGLAVDLKNDVTGKELDAIEESNGGPAASADAVLAYIQGKLDHLATSRPTAVNLFNALAEIKEALLTAKDNSDDGASPRERMVAAVLKHAKFMLERDLADNTAMGKHGASAILSRLPSGKKATIMTICNTGSLATGGFGTALGVVRTVHQQERLERVVALETRPYNQGSRLTAFEIVEDKLPGGTLICDSMAGYMMAQQQVDAVVVGADRVCANGDTANKIGTYSLSILAAAHHIPFFVAAPCTTLDTSLQSGADITIEERPAKELLETSRAPSNVEVWNPAFDVTPAKYITGIITEKGVITPTVDGKLQVPEFLQSHATSNGTGDDVTSAAAAKLKVPVDYTEQTVESLPAYLCENVPSIHIILGTDKDEEIECVEMGDGNLNLVFIVTNKADKTRQVIVKQALPYVRCVGESWPLTLERSYFEYRALTEEKKACPEHVPTVYHFSKPNGLMVMEYLAPPTIILRKGLIQGIKYPTMAEDIGTFCAKTLFQTSGFGLSTTQLREATEFWSSNREMCGLTEQVIFTEPYITAPNNRWTSPQLDEDKKAIENDAALIQAASKWKIKFVTDTSALIHGDLHSGSVMCKPEPKKSWVIDPEFAYYGPMGFDTGAFVANLFLNYVSQPGHKNADDYPEWVLQQIEIFWDKFTSDFLKQWSDPEQHTGFVYGRVMVGSDEAMKEAQSSWLKSILTDTLGFAGMKMLRRIVGIAHVEDLDSIEDADTRAICERHGLELAKTFIKYAHTFDSMKAAIQLARDKKP